MNNNNNRNNNNNNNNRNNNPNNNNRNVNNNLQKSQQQAYTLHSNHIRHLEDNNVEITPNDYHPNACCILCNNNTIPKQYLILDSYKMQYICIFCNKNRMQNLQPFIDITNEVNDDITEDLEYQKYVQLHNSKNINNNLTQKKMIQSPNNNNNNNNKN